MRYVPIVLMTVGLFGVVALMAGPDRRATRAVAAIAITLGGLLLLAILFGLIARRFV